MTAFSRFQGTPQAGKPNQSTDSISPSNTPSTTPSFNIASPPPVIARVPSSSQYIHPAILFSPQSQQPVPSTNRKVAPVMAITVASTNSDAESLILSRNNSPAVAVSDASTISNEQSSKPSKSPSSSRRSKSNKPNSETKLKKRLARKAELARASRRRKKAYISGLEDEILRLKSMVERMKAAAASGIAYVDDQPNGVTESLSSARKARRNLREGLKAMKEGDSDSDSDQSSCTSDDSASDDEDASNSRSNNRSAGLVNVVNAMNSMEVHSKLKSRRQSTNQSNNQVITNALLPIKVTYLDDTRRLTLSQANYRSLVSSVRSLWPSINEPIISYFDEDDDQVRITRDDEMAEAYRMNPTKSMKLVVVDAAPGQAQLNHLAPAAQDSDAGSVGSQDSLHLSRRLSQKRKHQQDETSTNQSKRRQSESRRSTDSGSSSVASMPRKGMPPPLPMNAFSPLAPIPTASTVAIPINQPINPIYNPASMCVMLCLELVSEVQGQFSITRAFCSLPLLATFHSLRDYLARNFFPANPHLASNFVFLIGNTPMRTRVYDENTTLLSFNCRNNDLVQFIHESLLQTPQQVSLQENEPLHTIEHDDDAAAALSTLAHATINQPKDSTLCAASA